MELRVQIPNIYRSFVKGSKEPVNLYYEFAKGYLAKAHSELTLIRFEEDVAICQLKEEEK